MGFLLMSGQGPLEAQSKSLDQEDCQLTPVDRVDRAVVSGAAAGGDAFGSELVDPVDVRTAGARLVGEQSGRTCGRCVGAAVLGLQEEHGHLPPIHGSARTIVSCTATARDAFGGELVDPVDEWTAGAGLV